MTEQTTTDQTGSGDASELSGVDLAGVALQQAGVATRNNGGEARAPRRRGATTSKRDGRETVSVPIEQARVQCRRQAAATEAAALRRALTKKASHRVEHQHLERNAWCAQQPARLRWAGAASRE